MTKRISMLIVASFISSIGIVFILFAISQDMRQQPGSFLREFPPHPVLDGNSFDIKYNSYYIAGGTSHHIYLGNHASPLHLLVLNTALTDTQHVKLYVKEITNQKFWSLRVLVDSPNFYLHDGAVPRIYKGNVNDWHANRFSHDEEYFLDLMPISTSSFFVKSLAAKNKESVLGKITCDTPFYYFKNGLLEKQIDGVFCTDGMMLYNKNLAQLIYLYRYRNQYIVMDTNLNLAYRGNTIDTISKAKIKVAALSSKDSKTMSAPPLMVNKRIACYKNWLFINSNLLAKNERPSSLEEANVIDVYNLKTSKYQFSFYIFNYLKSERLKEFQVLDNRLIALFDTHLQVFDLRSKYFGDQNGVVE